jgi:hypothetical protein
MKNKYWEVEETQGQYFVMMTDSADAEHVTSGIRFDDDNGSSPLPTEGSLSVIFLHHS